MSDEKVRVPQIRFAGFTGDWEELKLGEVGSTYTGLSGKSKIDFGHGEGRYITYMNVFSNAISSPKMVEPIEIDAKQNEVQAGDAFFTTSSETPEEVGLSSVLLENIPNTYLNSFCFGYRPIKEKFDNNYLAYMLRSLSVRENIVLLAQGISRYNISKNKVMEIEVPIPQMTEQRLLGDFFRNLDNLITLQQRQYDNLVILKKTMLEKMFPKDGANVPEIRFAGFTGAWEERKLSDFADKAVDNRGKTPPLDKNGTHPLIEVASLGGASPDYTKTEKYLNDFSFENNLRDYIKMGDILFSTVGSIGLVSMMDSRENAAIAQNIVAFRAKENYLSEYLYALFSTEENKNKANRIVMGAVQPSIKVSQLINVEYFVTKNEKEQKLLGKFFVELDNLISLNQRVLNALKTLKQSLLQQLFV